MSFAGCGAPSHPRLLSDDGEGGLGSVPPGRVGDELDFDSGALPGCGVGPDGGVCACLDLPVVGDPPNLYFVLDRSGSMNDLGKWQVVRTVVGQVVGRLGSRANFGVALFPAPNGDDACASGAEVLPVRAGGESAALTVLTVTNVGASGGTPTSATLTALTPKIMALPGKTFVILATDGGPNCNKAAVCEASQCIANIEGSPGCPMNGSPNCCAKEGAEGCLDAAPTVSAVAALKSVGIPTYVVGVPGSGPYAALLDQVALAGGSARTASPFYYRVDTAEAEALRKALAQIAAKIVASCSLPLGQSPPDPKLVNVYVDGQAVRRDPVNGWKVDGPLVTLLGTTCERVLSGEVLNVRVIAGCPTIVN